MGAPAYVLSDRANAELADLRKKLQTKVKFHLLTAQEAMAEYFEHVKIAVGAGAHVEASAERMILVECEYCARRETIRGDILRYTCNCTPNAVQFSFKNRVIEGVTPEGAAP